jgi:hypothetical protein
MNSEAPGTLLNEAGHLSRLLVARALAGDLDPAAKRGLDAHLLSCTRCGSLFATAKAEAAAFARRRPELDLGSSTETTNPVWKRTEESPGWWNRFLELFDRGFGMRPALAGLALLAVAVVIWKIGGDRPGDLTPKGGARFEVYLNGKAARGDALECAPADTLQLTIVSPAPVHYAVLYRDDDGPIQSYMADASTDGKALGSAQGDPLPHSLVMGKGWNNELLICVWSDRAFSASEAESAAAAAQDAKLPGGLNRQLIRLHNRGP